MKISIVSPVYLAEKLIPELIARLHVSLFQLVQGDSEIILIEDGSPDKSWEVIQALCVDDLKVKGIKLSRNFGQHYAISTGFRGINNLPKRSS